MSTVDVPDISKLSLGTPKAPATAAATATAGAAVPVPVDTVTGEVEDELERFRREWKNEVARRPAAAAAAVAAAATIVPPAASSADTASTFKGKARAEPVPISDLKLSRKLSPTSPTASTVPLSPTRLGTSPSSPSTSTLSTSPKIPFRAPTVRKGKDGAVALYARAVEAEQSGRLNDALRAYRLAFKADDNVDKLYARAMARNAAAAAAAAEVEAQEAADVTAVVDPSAPAVPDYDFRREIQVHPDHGPAAGRREKGLRVLLRAAPADAAFAPADEALPLPLARLPPELLEPVLSHLDVAAIEALGATCWRARALTADAGVWRRIASAIYRPPMVPPGIGGARELARRHGDYRTALVEEERIRLDGCYISVCHYIRPGAGEEWVAVTHMITYHRFLRFYADGSVISFLTTDHPSDVVPTLNRSIRGKGLHFGRWRLVRSDAEEEDEDNVGPDEGVKKGEKGEEGEKGSTATAAKPGAKPAPRHARILLTDLVEPGALHPKYEFEMDITLRQTHRGRWNKLDIARYSTVNIATGELLHLSLRHQKPFYFSKVRSWSPQL